MNYLAWTVFCLVILGFTLNCYYAGEGKEKKPYGITDIVTSMLSGCLLIPLVGRILGWW